MYRFVQLCESIERYSYYLAKECHKENFLITGLFFVAYYSIQTVAGSGHYGIESPLPYIRNFKTRLFLVA